MDVIEDLFTAYFRDAQFFAALHGVVALLVIGTLVNFARWKFDDEPPTTIWQQFEIRANFFHGMIGLFLIIGIAGTFLGLWEVASTLKPSAESMVGTAAGSASQASTTVSILLRGIAKAFPVGFVGLLYTFVANLVAGGVESYKRRKVETFMDAVGDPLTMKLVEALGPVANLGTTLERGLKPVISNLARVLEPIPRLMESQQQELSNAKDALVNAAEALESSGEQISASVTGLKEMAETAHAALDSAQELSAGIRSYFSKITAKLDNATERAADAFATYDRALDSMTESVSEAADAFRTFPAQLRGDVTAALIASYNEASEAREEELKELYSEARNHFQTNMVNAVSGVMWDLGEAKKGLETLTATMNTSIVNAQNAFGQYEGAWEKQAEKLREDIGKQIDPGIRKEMSANAKNALEALEEAARSGDAFVKSTKKTTGDIDRLYREAGDRLTTAANHLGNRLARMTQDIERSADRLHAVTERRATRPPGRFRRWGSAVWTVLRRPVRIFPRRKRP